MIKTANSSLQALVLVVAAGSAISALLLLVVPEFTHHRIILRTLTDAAHAPLFALLAWPLAWIFKPRTLRSYLALWAALGVAGLLVEVAQGFTGRDPSWFDVLNNQLGAIAGLALWAILFDSTVRNSAGLSLKLAACIVLAMLVVIYPVVRSIDVWEQREQRFPVLFDGSFADARNMLRPVKQPQDVALTIQHGTLLVDLADGPVVGVEVKDIAPDWLGYEQVVVDVENPTGQALDLAVLIGDFEGTPDLSDRFLAEVSLAPGERSDLTFGLADLREAPATRSMPLDKISEIVIYRVAGPARRFLLHSIYLQ